MTVRVSLDLDGCIYPWQEVAYEHECNFRDIGESYEEFWSTVNEKYSPLYLHNLTRIPVLYDKRDILPGVLETLEQLAGRYELYYITSRPKEAELVTERWIRKNKLPYGQNLIMTYNKPLVVAELEIDFHVDDLPSNLLALKGFTDLFMVKQPWNRHLMDEFLTIRHIPELALYLL